jgi:hypothetical protein
LLVEGTTEDLQIKVNDYLAPLVTRALLHWPERVRGVLPILPDRPPPNVDIPEDVLPNTVPLFLLATAGVRQLDDGKRTALIDCMDKCTPLSRFKKIERHGTITGEQEALFGWLAASHLRPSTRLGYVGYVEMGGASAQIAFCLSPADMGRYTASMAEARNKDAEENEKVRQEVRQMLPEFFEEAEEGQGPPPPWVPKYHEQYAKRNGNGTPPLPPHIQQYYEAYARIGRFPLDPLPQKIREYYEGRGPFVQVGGPEAPPLLSHTSHYYKKYAVDTNAVRVSTTLGEQREFVILLASYPLGSTNGRKEFDVILNREFRTGVCIHEYVHLMKQSN